MTAVRVVLGLLVCGAGLVAAAHGAHEVAAELPCGGGSGGARQCTDDVFVAFITLGLGITVAVIGALIHGAPRDGRRPSTAAMLVVLLLVLGLGGTGAGFLLADGGPDALGRTDGPRTLLLLGVVELGAAGLLLVASTASALIRR